MEFSGIMCLKIILKVTKNQSFNLFLEDTFFEKPQGGGGGGGQIDSPRRFRAKIFLNKIHVPKKAELTVARKEIILVLSYLGQQSLQI